MEYYDHDQYIDPEYKENTVKFCVCSYRRQLDQLGEVTYNIISENFLNTARGPQAVEFTRRLRCLRAPAKSHGVNVPEVAGCKR